MVGKPVTAIGSFACTVDKVEYFVREGNVYAADHPTVAKRPDLFRAEPVVEQATAAPGEKRGSRAKRAR